MKKELEELTFKCDIKFKIYQQQVEQNHKEQVGCLTKENEEAIKHLWDSTEQEIQFLKEEHL